MYRVKNLLRLLTAIALVAFALPSASQQYTKLYNLTLASDPSIPLQVVADLTNKALGPGNSNISFVQYTFSGATIANVTTVPVLPPSSVTWSGSTVTISFSLAGQPLKGGKHLIATITLKDCGDGITLPQSGVGVWTGSGGQPFSPDPDTSSAFPLTTSVVCGELACGDEDAVPSSFVDPNVIGPGTVFVQRGDRDKNGSLGACGDLSYTYTRYFDVDAAHFFWPLPVNSSAAWEYTIYSAGGSLPAAGTTALAWKNQNGQPVTNDPAYITGNDIGIPAGLDCIDPPILPAPYGTLSTTISATALSITVSVNAPADRIAHAASFDTLIGAERIRISSTQSQGPNKEKWTVAAGGRGVGGTSAAQHTASATALFMSTPLPILPASFPGNVPNIGPYFPNTQAQACIADQQVTDTGVPGLHFTTFIDIGDIWVRQP